MPPDIDETMAQQHDNENDNPPRTGDDHDNSNAAGTASSPVPPPPPRSPRPPLSPRSPVSPPLLKPTSYLRPADAVDPLNFTAAVQQSFAENGTPGSNSDTGTGAGGAGIDVSIRSAPAAPLAQSVTGTEELIPPIAATKEQELKKPGPNHNRTVSWGIQSEPVPLPSYGVDDSHSPARPILNLNDVLGATPELEAETYILQAVEKVSGHRPTNTEVSGLYSTIVEDEITHDMLQKEEEEEEDEEEEEHDVHPEIPMTPSTTSSTDGAKARASTAGGGRPVPTKQPSQSTLNSQKFAGIAKTHMRTKTVEGTLFGLATALTQLNEENDFARTQSEIDDDSEDEDELRVDKDTNFTAADKLVGTILQQQQDKKKNNETESSAAGDIESGTSTAPGGGGDDNNNSNNNNPDKKDKDKTTKKKKRKKKKDKRLSNLAGRAVKGASNGIQEEWQLFNTFVTTRKDKAKALLRRALVAIMVPSLLVAIFLFYFVENPQLCAAESALNFNNNGTAPPTTSPSSSPTLQPSMNPTTNSANPSTAPSIPFFEDEWLVAEFRTNDDDGFFNTTDENATISLWNDYNQSASPTGIPSVEPTPFPSTVPTSAPTADDIELFVKVFVQCPGLGASFSWWLLFVGVRQPITFILALLTQSLIIDYLALSSQLVLKLFGPILTLFLVQSKGWPFVITVWSLYNYAILARDTAFSHHWGYWQDWIGLFNSENPSGEVVNNEWYLRFLWIAIFVGVTVAVKRLVVGLLLGRNSFVHYGEQLAEVMKKMVLLGEVGTLARHIESTKEDYQHLLDDVTSIGAASSNAPSKANSANWTSGNIRAFVSKQADEADAAENEEVEVSESAADAANAFVRKRTSVAVIEQQPMSTKTLRTIGSEEADPEFTASQQVTMAELLEEWEEPHTVEEREDKKVTIGAVLQFRQALTFMKRKYPFLPAFGPADTRESCIDSAQNVYDRLTLRTPHKPDLPFETLALLAKNEKGELDQEKAKEIIRAFRPDRDGSLGKLEFVRSVDVIYKELRLLSANISNSAQMDKAVESLLNVVFYTVLVAVVIYILREDPVSLFLSMSSVILAFAFMFGKSAAKYFDGCLFILVQRPYGVGDRVHLSDPQNETNADGSSGWIVEKVTLFATHVYWGTTNERATLCNGAISNLRIINAARSPNATIYVPLKFGINTSYDKVTIFKAAVEQYLKDRPREWLTFVGFRPTEVAVDRGYVAYTVIAQHRSAWQSIGAIIESKANLTTYCLECAKQLDMRYTSPSLPVNLTVKDEGEDLLLPELGGEEGTIPAASSFDSGLSTTASPAVSQEAMSAISGTGLRNRKGRSQFADIVRMVMDRDKDK